VNFEATVSKLLRNKEQWYPIDFKKETTYKTRMNGWIICRSNIKMFVYFIISLQLSQIKIFIFVRNNFAQLLYIHVSESLSP